MSQSKAQLTNPLGTVDLSGLNATGVVTATTFKGDGTALTGIALTGNINTTGIITAGKFYGSGANLTGVGLGTQSSINTTGIITAGKFYGDGSGLTNIGGAFTVLTYQPNISSTNVGLTTNIILTFNKPIKKGTGTITLRTGSASGTVVESYDVSTSSNLSINGGVLTIDPTSSLSGLTTYFVVVPAGTVKDVYSVDNNSLIDTYSFTTQQLNFELWAWGFNAYGNLGQNNYTQYSSPRQIPGTQWTKVSYDYIGPVLATKTDGTLFAWGNNGSGELGQNDVTPQLSPVQIPGTQWNNICAGYNTGLATKTDGTLWVWGNNGNGNLGLNNVVARSSPVQIPGTQWEYVQGSDYSASTIATKTDGTLWVWGDNGAGKLGQNNLTQYSSPIQVPGTQWNGAYMNIAYPTYVGKTDGTLWAWGYNSDGQLGQNNIIPRSSPVQIPGTQWTGDIGTGYIHVLAVKGDGTLWSWGYNGSSRLGDGTTTSRSSPVQIPGTQWSKVEGGYNHSAALKNDGTFWAWGENTYGQAGKNNTTASTTPVQGATNASGFIDIAGRIYSALAIKQVAP
jgi:alpha-tubulin suppressor-like RCC1 family protein